MGPVEAVKTCFRKYAVFSGRASLAEYWWFALFLAIASLATAYLDSLAFGSGLNPRQPITGIFNLAVLLPFFSVAWRRFQDTGKPGWLSLAPLAVALVIAVLAYAIPTMMTAYVRGVVERTFVLVMTVLMIWWLTRPSAPEANRYGPPPSV